MSTLTCGVSYFPPSHWGDMFLNFAPLEKASKHEKEQEVEHLKEEVKKELLATVGKPLKQLNFIDAIERLGVAYHFEKEIEEALLPLYESYHDQCEKDDLYHISTRFRILRQHGFYVPCDVFNKFTNDQGGFKGCILNDMRGMLSLYEASHVRIHDDDILDEALVFTTSHLTKFMDDNKLMSSPLAEQVGHALRQSLHRGFVRLESKHYVKFYEQDASHNKTLLKLAKLDFNLLQLLHKEELRDITSWWKDLFSKVTFTRDRLVEGYFWILGCYYEPEYSYARKIFMKIFMMLQLFDDLFDAYGTYEILELLVEAVHRWDHSYISRLPEKFNTSFQVLLEVVDEAEKHLAKEGRSFAVDHLKMQFYVACETWLQEAKWLRQKYTPTYDEYLKNARVSIAYNIGIISSYIGMGPVVTKENLEWVYQDPMPKLVEASYNILRLMNDVAGTKYEQATRDHVVSAVQCYMNEHGILDEEQAYQAVEKHVEDAWKDFNQGMLRPYMIPKPLLDRILHLNRAADVFYKGRHDAYTNPNQIIQDKIASILVDPIPI